MEGKGRSAREGLGAWRAEIDCLARIGRDKDHFLHKNKKKHENYIHIGE